MERREKLGKLIKMKRRMDDDDDDDDDEQEDSCTTKTFNDHRFAHGTCPVPVCKIPRPFQYH